MSTYDNCDIVGTIAELMMDQVEFANVILLNKIDLVKEEQQKEILEKLQALNPQAKVVKSLQSKIDVMDILNTNLYKDKDDFYVTSTKHESNQDQETEANKNTGKRVPEACTARFDIKSFVYRARYNFKSLQDQGKNQVMNHDQDQLEKSKVWDTKVIETRSRHFIQYFTKFLG